MEIMLGIAIGIPKPVGGGDTTDLLAYEGELVTYEGEYIEVTA